MIEYEIEIFRKPMDDIVDSAVRDISEAEGLVIQMKTSLKKYPGCTHWHFKRPDACGILELTWWPGDAAKRADRMWLSVHGNRNAAWISELIPRVKTLLEKQLSISS